MPQPTSKSNVHPRSRQSTQRRQFPPLPTTFTNKKSQIVAAISVPADSYADKSPKGSIDEPIVELIRELNEIDGIVTTSSCSGRVAVFVEGPRGSGGGASSGGKRSGQGAGEEVDEEEEEGGNEDGDEVDVKDIAEDETQVKAMTGSPAGKGGGRWLYVSHSPVNIPSRPPSDFFTKLCGLTEANSTIPVDSTSSSTAMRTTQPPRLIRLSFSPLILHVLCASLAHAKPLLSAAINAGFRESGVQSLRALDDPDAGVMVGIRTAGLAFETVVGVVREVGSSEDIDAGVEGEGGKMRELGCKPREVYEQTVNEAFLGMAFGVINERFVWNERRKERLREEIRRGFGIGVGEESEWEDSEVRRRRKREEGLKRKKAVEEERKKTKRNGLEGGNEHKREPGSAGSAIEDIEDFLALSTTEGKDESEKQENVNNMATLFTNKHDC